MELFGHVMAFRGLEDYGHEIEGPPGVDCHEQ